LFFPRAFFVMGRSATLLQLPVTCFTLGDNLVRCELQTIAQTANDYRAKIFSFY
jgi:hypothetical protein